MILRFLIAPMVFATVFTLSSFAAATVGTIPAASGAVAGFLVWYLGVKWIDRAPDADR